MKKLKMRNKLVSNDKKDVDFDRWAEDMLKLLGQVNDEQQEAINGKVESAPADDPSPA